MARPSGTEGPEGGNWSGFEFIETDQSLADKTAAELRVLTVDPW